MRFSSSLEHYLKLLQLAWCQLMRHTPYNRLDNSYVRITLIWVKGRESLLNLLLIHDYIITELKTCTNSVQILAMLGQFFELLVRDASHLHIHAKSS